MRLLISRLQFEMHLFYKLTNRINTIQEVEK